MEITKQRSELLTIDEIKSMSKKTLVEFIKLYFDVRELVCNHTYSKFGVKSWQFLDREFLENLLVVRTQILKVGMVCNNWHTGGPYSQRGLRCNICQLVKDKTLKGQIYLSAHCNGAGSDFSIMGGKTAAWAREQIKNKSGLLPNPIRLEKDVSWLHMDIYDSLNGLKVTEFNG